VLLRRGVVSGGKVSPCQDRVSPSQGEGTRRLLRASHLRYGRFSLGLSSEWLLFKSFSHQNSKYTYCFLKPGQSVQRLVCELDDWSIEIRLLARTRDSSLLFSIQTGLGTHPLSYAMDNGILLSGDKVAGAWSWPLRSTPEVKNAWCHTPTLPPLHITVLIMRRDNFTF
jgi:hypothetical protein